MLRLWFPWQQISPTDLQQENIKKYFFSEITRPRTAILCNVNSRGAEKNERKGTCECTVEGSVTC